MKANGFFGGFFTSLTKADNNNIAATIYSKFHSLLAHSQNNISRWLPDSTNVALSATTKQIVHIHDPRSVLSPL